MITDDYVRWVGQRLYNRPRKVLGFKSSLDVHNEDLLNTVANQN